MKFKRSIVLDAEHLQLALCPFCAGYGEPYLAHLQQIDDNDNDPDEYWQVRCGECDARAGMCASIEYAITNWNDVSLILYPDQITCWPGAPISNARGSAYLEKRRAHIFKAREADSASRTE